MTYTRIILATSTALFQSTMPAVLASLMLSGCTMVSGELPGRDTGAVSRPREELPVEEDTEALTPQWKELQPYELRSAVLSYADRYMERIAEAVDEVLSREPDLKISSLFQGTKVIYISSAITIAAEPDPGASLLDMAVMVSLQRVVWEEDWEAYVGREYSMIMSEALKGLEADVFHLASKVLADEQAEILRELIMEWRRQNPTQHYVAYVRFDDFAPSRMKDRFNDELMQSGGLLAPMKEAVREIEEVKMLAERGIFLANHFPIAMEWHMEYLFSKISLSPAVSGLLEDSRQLTATSTRLVEAMEGLPDRLSKERADLLKDLAVRVAEERKRTLDKVVMAVQEQREGLLRDLREGGEELSDLLEKVERAGIVLRDMAQSLEKLIGADEPPVSGEAEDEVSGLEALDVTLGNISATAAELNFLVKNLEAFATGQETTAVLDDVDARLRAHEKQLFLYGAGLIVLFFVSLIFTVMISKRLRNTR